MKKIYILTAVFALLTLSLNAQLTTSKNKVVKPETSTEKVVTPPDGYFRMGPSRASTDPVTPPYSNGFDNSTETSWWEVIDANSDGSTWTFSGQRAVYTYNSDNAANDWLITAPVYLEVGKIYKFYIKASRRSSSYMERLEVKLATANNETALSNGATIIAATDVTSLNNNYTTFSNENVTVTTSGNYYFGIHAISIADRWELYVEDLVIDVEDTDPKVTVSRDQLTISDSGTNNTFDVQALNIVQGENLGVTPHNGFSTTCTSSTNTVADWGFYQNNGSVNGTVAVNYTGRALTASDDIAVGTLGASTTVHVDYVPDLYIYCDNGVSPWNFSANPAVVMTNNGDGTYTATLQNIPANSHILFGRASGLTYTWEGDDNRLFIGASTDGGDWGYGDNTSGYLDTNPNDDYPVKYHPIYFSEGGTYTITIDANDYTFTIDKLVYPAPENVVATPDSENKTATVTWDVPSNLPTVTETVYESVTEGFENGTTGWTFIDADGDGYNWTWYDNSSASSNMITNNGTCIVYSESYRNNAGGGGTILYPDNWLISPEVVLDGTLSLYACGQDANGYHKEVFGVYVCVGSYNGISSFVQVGADVTTTHDMTEYTYDLSQYQGQLGHIAIVHHNVYDQFILNIDDVTYQIATTAEVPVAPISYNIYLDGQLVGSVNANNALTYNFSNLAVGDHECAVSAVYPGGIESEAVPAQFNIMARTAMPTISVVANADGSKTITATGDGTVHLYVDGQEVSNPYTIMPSIDGDITVTVTATAQEEGKLISETAEQIVTVAEAGRTPMPVITTQESNGYVVITATGDGTVTLTVDGQTVTGEGSASITIVKSFEDQNVTATATAQDGDLAESHTATLPVTIPALNTTPTNPESGLLRLHLLIVDQMKEEIPADNSHPDRYNYVLRYEPNGPQGEGVKESATVKVDIQKADCEVTGYYSLKQIDGDTIIGLDHKQGITMDVVTADVAYDLSDSNDLLYEYLLQGAKNRDPGYQQDYLTKLRKSQNFTYFEMLDGPDKGTEYPNGEHHYLGEIETGTWGSTFMSYAPSVSTWGIQRRYYEDDGYDNTYGAPIWKSAVGEVKMSEEEAPIAERQTNQWNSVNWDDQGGPASLYILDNIWATAKLPHTGLATVQYEPYMFRVFVQSNNGLLRPYEVVEQGEGQYDGEHLVPVDRELTEADMKGPKCVWSGYLQFDEDGEVIGDLPNGVEVQPGTDDGGQKTFTYHKSKVDRQGGSNATLPQPSEWDKDPNNAMFGALDALAISGYDAQGKPILRNDITEDDLKIFVRFYYVVKGMADGWTPGTRGQGDDPAGYGSESGSSSPGIATSVNEIRYHGEAVETIYYNVQGMSSDRPFEGVNIVVTRYSDGATVVSKVIR